MVRVVFDEAAAADTAINGLPLVAEGRKLEVRPSWFRLVIKNERRAFLCVSLRPAPCGRVPAGAEASHGGRCASHSQEFFYVRCILAGE